MVERKRRPKPSGPAAHASREGKSFRPSDTSHPRKDAEREELHFRPAEQPLPEDVCFDHIGHRVKPNEHRQEALIDEAVEETFPASDPIAPKHIT